MKRLEPVLFCLIVVLLCYWHPVHHGYCSEQNQLDLQNQPQTASDVPNRQDEPEENSGNDKDALQDPLAVYTVEHQTQADATDEPQIQETALQDNIVKDVQVDKAPVEAAVLEHDPESSIRPEDDDDDAGSQNSHVSPLPVASVTESQTPVSEDLSSTATVSPAPSACSVDDDFCSSSPVSPVSPTAACDAGENPSYDADLNSLPMENSSTPGTGKGTKASLGRASQGTNASSMLKEQGVPVSTETDPSLPSKDAEDIPTFDEWKKIMMEVENEKSQTTHTSCNGGSSAVKKVQKTTNYASVECGAKILASNPEAKSTSAILMENVDVYMLNPCSNKIWFVIELCQPIQVKQLDIANFELFSSTPKDFLVSISDRYPTNKWAKLGTFHARDERTVQSFPLDEHLYAKYVKVELLSHFGSEHFCPLSLLRVFGTSMMEEYELNSEPSERLNSQDEDDDYPPGYVPSDDRSSKNLIGSAKDVILNMVNNIAANVLGGNPEDGAQSGGNYSSLDLNLTETSGTPVPTVSSTSSKIMMESLEVDQHELNKVTETPSVTQRRDTGPTAPLPTTSLSETATLSAPEPIGTTTNKGDQIVTLLPEDELDEPDKSSSSITQKAVKEGVKAPQNQQYSGVKETSEHTPDSCSCGLLKEYLLQTCIPHAALQRKKPKKKSHESHSQSKVFHEMETSVPVMSSSSLVQGPDTWTVETTSQMEASVVVVPSLPENEHGLEVGSLDLAPSLTSALVTFPYTDTLASRATHVVDFLDPLAVESSDLKLNENNREKPVEDKSPPILTCNLELTSTPVLTTKSDEMDQVQMSVSAVEKSPTEKNPLTPSMMTSTMDQATFTPLATSTDQPFAQPTISKSATPVVTLPAAPGTETLEVISIVAEPKREDLVVEEASLGGHSGNIQTGTYSNGQSVQPSSSDFYAEIPGSTETPIHGSNQKESVFMRLNNRIKALEVNMSLSSRYLEQLSQRYRKQMEEMQKAFNKTIIKLQNTSRMAEEQDQKQTESIQVLQRQLENVTRLVLNLSLQVSQLQREVSDRHSYLLLSVVLGSLICIVICVNYCRMPAPSAEPDASIPNSYSYCCLDRESPGYEDVNPKRRASYPFSQSSLQIATTEGPSEAYNVETRRNSTGSKKKKRCKMKSGRKPETITPTLLSTLSAPNGGLQYNNHCPHNMDLKLPPCSPGPPPFSFRNSQSEGSSGDSSQSDEPSFCGIASCSRICDPLPAPKSHSKKRNRLKKSSTVLKQLLQPVECNGPPIASKFTLHGLITGSTELSTNSLGVPLLRRKNSFD
ncbi:SUN domain-containing ossification factor-like isoform X2 [Neoarius graeffei]|uniref:SUN domain-containing ossification factor-like isoform X2 n=1 Tax=Neoarius graeffei TaxID=443677 RepID=UPI00298C710A|nr:SUN domain-containing ossification factor-like isoform X2 [Neoarius graeffei]